MVPANLTLIRQLVIGGTTNEIKPLANASSRTVATTPFFGALLPKALTLETLGESKFVLRGPQAGEISAVMLRRADKVTRVAATASGAFAQVDLDGQKL